MEVQTFLLAGTVQYSKRQRGFNITQAPAHSFAPEDAQFPFRCEVMWLLVLRRSSRSGVQPFTFRIQLVDDSGNPLEGNSALAVGNFDVGQKFMIRNGNAIFTFPSPGDYRIDLFADETSNASVYSYDIEITSERYDSPA